MKKIIEQMTIEEKCAYLSGKDEWSTRSFKSLGIPPLHCSDGPSGVRKQKGEGDHLGINPSVPATCFPTSATLSNSWDEKLLERVGIGLGKEAAAEDVNVLLGPGINIKRNPLCGRNFEYYSEDPYLSGKLAAAIIRGIQSENVSACIKHYAVNSQELRRMAMNSVIDERTLREIYLTAFEIAIKEANPHAVMTSYNEVNGEYSNENKHLLMDILRGEFGFKGTVITDWGGSNDHALGVKYGSTLEMPAPGLDSARILLKALKENIITEDDINKRVEELLNITFITKDLNKNIDKEKLFETNHKLARQAATKSIVLLKNENDILPIKKDKKLAIIGDFAFEPRYQGAGSSMVNAVKVDNVENITGEFDFEVIGMARGYSREDKEVDENVIKEAIDLAKVADIVLFFFGLNEDSESEGLDREHLRIPQNQIDLMEELFKANDNIVGVISAGSSIEMPWHHYFKAILHGYLFGQAGMGACFDILSGNVSPSGKLTETIIKKYEDVPNFKYYPSLERNSEYREGIFVGYRYYQSALIPVLYPFGYGMSYTSFKYSNINVEKDRVSFVIENVGEFDASEIAQLYISFENAKVFRAKKELKGFAKVYLNKRESKEVVIKFDDKTFRYWNVKTNKWEVETGEYTVLIGASCEDIRLSANIFIEGTTDVMPYDKSSLKSYYKADIRNVSSEEYEILLGKPIPSGKWSGELGINDALCQMYYAKSPVARYIFKILHKRLEKAKSKGVPDLNTLFQYNMPFRAIGKMCGDLVSMDMVREMVVLVNGHFFKGLFGIIREYFRNRKLNKEYKRKYLTREDSKC